MYSFALISLCLLSPTPQVTSVQVQQSVPLWTDLALLDGRVRHQSVFVQETKRAGDAVFTPTAELPVWAVGSDLMGLCIGDASGTGKWVHRWKGPVDFGRLGTVQDGLATDEREALDALIGAGLNDIYFPEGTYDAYLDHTVSTALRITGAGPDKTIFIGDEITHHSVFNLESTLTIENVRFQNQARLASINLSGAQNLGMLRLKLRGVVFEADIPDATNAVIQAIPTGPLSGTWFTLTMEECEFHVSPLMDHINARTGLLGSVERCRFYGGKRGIYNIPTSDGDFAGLPANDFSPDFRLTECLFDDFTYTGSADSYHLQVAGRRWVISGCTFGDLSGTGLTSSGHLYSNLQDSHLIGCSFVGGGSFHWFAKGAERLNPSTSPTGGNGWGNTAIGCTFDGFSTSVLQRGQVYMNVREQRFIGCTFRGYETYAIYANQQGTNSDNLLVDDCAFETTESSSAIRILNGGRNIRILNSRFNGITGPQSNTRGGLIVLEAFPEQTTIDYDDMVIEGCSFQDNLYPAIYFYGNTGSARDYFVNNLRFLNNTLQQSGGGFLSGSAADIQGMILEGNYISVGNNGWNMPTRCLRRSIDNTWIDNGGSHPPNEEALGVASGSILLDQTTLVGGETIAIPSEIKLVRVAGDVAAVTAALDDGAFGLQQIILVGVSDSRSVTVLDGGNAALGSDRVLGAGDTLALVWDGVSQWCELSYADN